MREANRKLAVVIFSTLVLSSVAGAMQSLALKWLVDSAINRRFGFAVVAAVVGGVGAGLLGSAGRAMSDTELVVTNQVGLIIDRRTLELTAGMPGIEHLERPEYLDQISLIRNGGASLMRAVFALTGAASLAISMGTGLWLLARRPPAAPAGARCSRCRPRSSCRVPSTTSTRRTQPPRNVSGPRRSCIGCS